MMMIKGFAIAGALLLGSALAASADDMYVFKDVRSAPGHARSEATKLADGRACGGNANNYFSDAKLPGLLKCMSSRGWAVARIEPYLGTPVQQASKAPRVTVTAGAGADNDRYWDNYWAQQQSSADTAAWTQDQENAVSAEIGADTVAQGQAAFDAAEQAASQAEQQAAFQQ